MARDGCIREDLFLGHTHNRRQKHVERRQGREDPPSPETLPHGEFIRALPITQPHACLNAVGELEDDGEHCRWHARTRKDIPRKGSVDRVVCFVEVDSAQVHGVVVGAAM